MIIPDVNLLVCAHNSSASHHLEASAWFEKAVTAVEPVGIAWAAVFGFIRLLSNPRVVASPDRPERLVSIVKSWLALPSVRVITPGIRHLEIVGRLFEQTGCTSRLATDVHLAALSIELDATLCSTDRDFQRFNGLKLVNPL